MLYYVYLTINPKIQSPCTCFLALLEEDNLYLLKDFFLFCVFFQQINVKFRSLFTRRKLLVFLLLCHIFSAQMPKKRQDLGGREKKNLFSHVFSWLVSLRSFCAEPRNPVPGHILFLAVLGDRRCTRGSKLGLLHPDHRVADVHQERARFQHRSGEFSMHFSVHAFFHAFFRFATSKVIGYVLLLFSNRWRADSWQLCPTCSCTSSPSLEELLLITCVRPASWARLPRGRFTLAVVSIISLIPRINRHRICWYFNFY